MKKLSVFFVSIFGNQLTNAQANIRQPVGGLYDKFLILLPIFLLIFLVFIIFRKLSSEHYRLTDMLSENKPVIQPEKKVARESDESVGNKIQSPVKTSLSESLIFRPSTSRFIAFISGMAMIIISICGTSYSFYYYLQNGSFPQTDAFINFLLATATGFLPYALNKLSGFSEK